MEKQYLSVVCKNIGMDIHVRAPIEFEKILDYTFTNSIQIEMISFWEAVVCKMDFCSLVF